MSAADLLGNKTSNADFRLAKHSDFPHLLDMRFPMPYACLTDPKLTKALSGLAHSTRHKMKSLKRAIYSASIQPSRQPVYRNQDRLAIQEWDFACGTWIFAAVFDGHGGHECVDYAVEHLPGYVRKALEERLQEASGAPSSAEISTMLQKCIVAFDDDMGSALRDLFPEQFDDMTDDQFKAILDAESDGEKNMTKFLRCFRGAVVVVALVDRSTDRLWVANLGDCQAVLASRFSETKWDIRSLANDHNARNPTEAERIRMAHPNEDDCVVDGRVLGKTAPSRTLGNWDQKFPAAFVSRLNQHHPHPTIGFRYTAVALLERNKTPPYMSSVAEITFEQLPKLTSDGAAGKKQLRRFLLLASDGLLDMCKVEEPSDTVRKKWVDSVVRAPKAKDETHPLRIIRDALGGDDTEKVSMNLFVPTSQRWIDDTTIIVLPL